MVLLLKSFVQLHLKYFFSPKNLWNLANQKLESSFFPPLSLPPPSFLN